MGALSASLATWFALAGAGAAPEGAGERGATNGFHYRVREIEGETRERMTGVSWRPGCPVHIDNLRLIRATHLDFRGGDRLGSVIVHKHEAGEIVRVLRSLYRRGFEIRRMQLIERYDGSDDASMRADNTSGFNCRYVAGTTTWSQHAYGRAIDVNPVENPYVTPSGQVSPPAGAGFVDRSQNRKGMIHRGDAAYEAFRREGWKWGGNWSGAKDYQHFSRTGG
jgi:hypothetical protein